MDIIEIPSPNFSIGRRRYVPQAIVIHIMEGTLAGADSWFSNPKSKVSAHYGIGINGEIHRYVKESDTAWHAGRVHDPLWPLIKRDAASDGYINPNYYTIGIEHEGFKDSEWTDSMYKSSAELIADIASRWHIPIDREHIIGHREIYSIKSCPGSRVSIERLIEIARQEGHA